MKAKWLATATLLVALVVVLWAISRMAVPATPSGVIHGVVVDDESAPVAGAVVRVRATENCLSTSR